MARRVPFTTGGPERWRASGASRDLLLYDGDLVACLAKGSPLLDLVDLVAFMNREGVELGEDSPAGGGGETPASGPRWRVAGASADVLCHDGVPVLHKPVASVLENFSVLAAALNDSGVGEAGSMLKVSSVMSLLGPAAGREL